MKGLTQMIVDKEMVLEAIQEYLDKSVTPNVDVTSVAPYSASYGNNAVSIPDKFQITVSLKDSSV